MLVVSDASPVNVLVRIGHIETLPKLFQTVAIPPAVERELSHAATPAAVREWMASRPKWLQVRKPSHVDLHLTRDPGEREAICLAREMVRKSGRDDVRAEDVQEAIHYRRLDRQL